MNNAYYACIFYPWQCTSLLHRYVLKWTSARHTDMRPLFHLPYIAPWFRHFSVKIWFAAFNVAGLLFSRPKLSKKDFVFTEYFNAFYYPFFITIFSSEHLSLCPEISFRKNKLKKAQEFVPIYNMINFRLKHIYINLYTKRFLLQKFQKNIKYFYIFIFTWICSIMW